MSPVVVLENLCRTFEGPPPVDALNGINLAVQTGDYLALIGPSGSGKSTLLHLLGLLDRPTSGTYLLDGIDTNSLSELQRAGLRASRIGFVFQAFHLLGHRSNVENVMLADVYRSGGRSMRRQRAVEALEAVGLGHRLDGFPTTLSGGERQRVAIARALVSDPSIILADEPTGNLDSQTGDQIMNLFADLHRRGLTVVIITHDESVAARTGRVCRIRDGCLEAVSKLPLAAGIDSGLVP